MARVSQWFPFKTDRKGFPKKIGQIPRSGSTCFAPEQASNHLPMFAPLRCLHLITAKRAKGLRVVITLHESSSRKCSQTSQTKKFVAPLQTRTRASAFSRSKSRPPTTFGASRRSEHVACRPEKRRDDPGVWKTISKRPGIYVIWTNPCSVRGMR